MAKEKIKVTPKHLQYSLAMAEIQTSEEHADLILRILVRVQKLGVKFSIHDACEIRAKWEQEWDAIKIKNE